jgi:ferredoxin
MPNIYFKTTDKKVSFEEGVDTNLLRASIRYEGGVPYKCGGGLCGTCKVFVEDGAENLTDIKKHEVARLGDLTQQGYRLACQTFAKGDCKVSWNSEVKVKTNEKLKEYWEKSS